MIADWGDEGEIDLLDFFAELTIYTSSACLIGQKFREQLDGRFAHLYHDLERGTDAALLRRPLRRHRELPHARRGPRRDWSSWCRRSWTAATPTRRQGKEIATCSTS